MLHVDGRAGLLLPGFRDDHLHLGAWVRSRVSRRVTSSRQALDELAGPRDAGADGPLVLYGLDHHNWAETLGRLDGAVMGVEHALLVHRTLRGMVELRRGDDGEIRVREGWRRGAWRDAVRQAQRRCRGALLRQLRDRLLSEGVVAVTDATPYPTGAGLTERDIAALAPVRVRTMTAPPDTRGRAASTDPCDVPVKIVDWRDPDGVDRLRRSSPRTFAFHAVDADEVVWAARIARPGDRIEHAAICPPEVARRVRDARVSVCLNPAFLVERSAALAEVRRSGLDEFLGRADVMLDLGVPLTVGSDAPVASPGIKSSLQGLVRRDASGASFAGRGIDEVSAVRIASSDPELVGADASRWLGGTAQFVVIPVASWADVVDGDWSATLLVDSSEQVCNVWLKDGSQNGDGQSRGFDHAPSVGSAFRSPLSTDDNDVNDQETVWTR